ncbi:hypothetical protein D3C85_1834580 [compost metagenome]
MIVETGGLNHRRDGIAAFEIKLHVAGFVGGYRDQIASRVQAGSIALRIIGMQLEVRDVALHVYDQPRFMG